jgi:glucose-6-phosphate-specific signal transduction histidine kinase
MSEHRRLPWVAAVGFWVFVSMMYAAQIWWLSRLPGERINLRSAITWQTTYFLLWIPLTLVVWRLTWRWMPDGAGGWTGMFLRHVPLFAATAFVHFVAVAGVSVLLGVSRGAFWPSVGMQVSGRLHLEVLIYTAAAGTGAALVLHRRYRDRELAAIRLQGELAAARLDALQRQLQPHFLFNSLHSIASLARAGDTAGVVRLIAGFSDILRHLLTAGERHLALRDELQLVDRYLEIQRVRFADRLDAAIELAPEAAGARVPLLVVQPLVENALRHGLGPRVGGGRVLVRASRENGSTRIDVEDSGVGLPAGWSMASATGTGLRNLQSRLDAEFGARASLAVAPRPGGGVVATVRIPYEAA